MYVYDAPTLVSRNGRIACAVTNNGRPQLKIQREYKKRLVELKENIFNYAILFVEKYKNLFLFQYGAFLAIILVLELGAGISIFAYRSKLTAGFDKGLNQSIINYRSESAGKSADIDIMQATLHCCGNHRYTDWSDNNLPVPLSCCKVENCNTANEAEIYTQ
ncbi:hypothetical protein ILUMI_18296, partial [Ignelater luminosus]